MAATSDSVELASLAAQVWLATYAKAGVQPAHREYTRSTFTEANFNDWINADHYRLLVCERNNSLQAFALINMASQYGSPDNGYELERLYVRQSAQGQGIGKALLARMELDYGKPYWLYSWVENASNQFYLARGMQQIDQVEALFDGQVVKNNVYLSADI